MIAADLTETWSRMAVVDFSKPFLATSLTLLLQASCHLAVIWLSSGCHLAVISPANKNPAALIACNLVHIANLGLLYLWIHVEKGNITS